MGDWIFSDGGDSLERMRVRQSVIRADSGSADSTCTVVLNDKLLELEIQLNRKVEGITGGATLGGGSSAMPTDPAADTAAADKLAPSVPTGLSVTSAAYVDQSGAGFAAMTASWLQVTTNVDGSAVDDLEQYVVSWQNISGDWVFEWVDAANTKAYWSPVFLGQVIPVRVGVYDRSGNFSGWSATVTHTAVADATPPPVPKAPVVTPWLGTLRIDWDGKGSAGEAMPADMRFVEVHASAISDFTPTSATMIDQLYAAGRVVYAALLYGTAIYVRLVAVDQSGNRSAASAQVSSIPAKIVGDDISSGSIGFNEIGFKDLNNLAIDGSFENPLMDAARVVSGVNTSAFGYRTTSTPFHAIRYMRTTLATLPTDTRQLDFTGEIPVKQGDTFWTRGAFRRTPDANGTVQLAVRYNYQDGTTGATIVFNISTSVPGTSVWTTLQNTTVVPANAVTAKFYMFVGNTASTGFADVDALEIREVIGTSLIQDLAVNNAKIGDLSVGKLTAGTLTSDVTLSARIKTANSGARVEINSLGVQAFNSGNVKVVDIGSDGSVEIVGTLRTGPATGRRIEMNPVGAGNPEFRIYPTGAGGRYAYLHGFDHTSTAAGVRLSSARSGLDDESGIQSSIDMSYDKLSLYVGNQTSDIRSRIDLYASGSMVINADGEFSINTVTGSISLRPGGGGVVSANSLLRSSTYQGISGGEAKVTAGGDGNICGFWRSGGNVYVHDFATNTIKGPL